METCLFRVVCLENKTTPLITKRIPVLHDEFLECIPTIPVTQNQSTHMVKHKCYVLCITVNISICICLQG